MFYTCLSMQDGGEASIFLQKGNPTQRHILLPTRDTCTFTSKGDLGYSFALTIIFLRCGRNLEYPERTHACKLHACFMQMSGFEPRTFCKTTVPPTPPACSSAAEIWNSKKSCINVNTEENNVLYICLYNYLFQCAQIWLDVYWNKIELCCNIIVQLYPDL